MIEPDQENEETDFVKFRPKITAYSSNTNRQSRISVLNQRFYKNIYAVIKVLKDYPPIRTQRFVVLIKKASQIPNHILRI